METALRVVGPDFSAHCLIDPAGSETIVGRDPSCHIVLPDPKRNVSRRHLAIWTQGSRIFFRVISTVAGITTSLRKYGPGESGELQFGHFLKFSDYTLNTEEATAEAVVSKAAPAKSGIGSALTPDPWAELDSQWAGQGPQTLAEYPSSVLEPDPFGEWELDSPPVLANANQQQRSAVASETALVALLQGMGVGAEKLRTMRAKELEALGRRIRTAVQGIITLEANMEATQSKLGFKHNEPSNPLIGQRSPSAKIEFLLGTGPAPGGKLSPDDALNDLIMRLHAHEAAMMAASRATAMGVLTDLDPATVKASFDKTGPHLPLLASGKLWEFFGKHYEGIGANLPRWLADVMARHFAPYYSREYDKNRKQ